MAHLPVLLTPTEVAELLRTSRKAICAMVERAQLPGVVRIGRRVLVREDTLLDWLGQKRAPSPEELVMSVTIRPYRRGGWEVDIRVVTPDGARQLRERKLAPMSARSAAVRWAEAAKETIVRVHLSPLLGHKTLNAIKSEDVQHLKGRLSTKAAKTVNNILTVLNVLLKKAVDWDVIDRMPCSITLLPVPKTSMSFYDFDEYERLVAAASSVDATAYTSCATRFARISQCAGRRHGQFRNWLAIGNWA